MQSSNNHIRLAQSASALGAALLGFGIGAIWGNEMSRTILIPTLIIGAIIHVAGMYVTQMKNGDKASGIAKMLWISAWLCLIILIGIFIYLLVKYLREAEVTLLYNAYLLFLIFCIIGKQPN
jgi:hypothetical protein